MTDAQTRVSPNHKTHNQLQAELAAAKTQVKIGGIYAHYKYPENTYRVTALAFREASDELCVVYQALYDPELFFVRELGSWLETPEVNGVKVPRFKAQS